MSLLDTRWWWNLTINDSYHWVQDRCIYCVFVFKPPLVRWQDRTCHLCHFNIYWQLGINFTFDFKHIKIVTLGVVELQLHFQHHEGILQIFQQQFIVNKDKKNFTSSTNIKCSISVWKYFIAEEFTGTFTIKGILRSDDSLFFLIVLCFFTVHVIVFETELRNWFCLQFLG